MSVRVPCKRGAELGLLLLLASSLFAGAGVSSLLLLLQRGGTPRQDRSSLRAWGRSLGLVACLEIKMRRDACKGLGKAHN